MNSPAKIRSYSEAICQLATPGNLSLTVPSCPDWSLGDLVFHVGSVHRFWASAVAARTTQRPVELDEVDVDDGQLLDWFRSQTNELLSVLGRVESDSPCWTWWGEPRTAGAVERHQVQEAAIHLWDAQLACGVIDHVDMDVALDGISEFLHVESGAMTLPEKNRIVLTLDDADGEWTVGGETLSPITVSGHGSDVLLVLHGRKGLGDVHVDGDASIVQLWLDSIDLN